MRLRRASSGFTLTELVLVIAVIGILAAIGAPRFFALDEFEERFFFDEVLAALRYAQKLAVATGCDTQVDFTVNSYTLQQRASCASGSFTESVVHPGTGAAAYSGQSPGTVAVASTVDPIVFDALGRALNASGVVSDASVAVGTRSIATEGETGFVRAQ